MEKYEENRYEMELQEQIDRILKIPVQDDRLRKYFEAYKERMQIATYRELDQVIFRRMYGREPEKTEDLKIRYWRCGQHIPQSREEMIRLGLALQVNRNEMDRMLTEILLEIRLNPLNIRENVWIQRFETGGTGEVYEDSYREAEHGKAETREGEKEKEFLDGLCSRYLTLVPEKRLMELQIKGSIRKNLRHILFADIAETICLSENDRNYYMSSHSYSSNFASECRRYFKKNEKVSRETMERLLIVMLMPEVNREILNQCLVKLGYAPLSERIRRKSGACMEDLLLWILEQFERYRSGEFEEDLRTQRAMLRCVDRVLVERLSELKEKEDTCKNRSREQRKILQDLRPMKFRSFGKEVL
ncbi:MAG: hypothetical protein KH828_12475 [Clostridiales bacterium]|nr:hypothetical protein [Clostridiales bacterium]